MLRVSRHSVGSSDIAEKVCNSAGGISRMIERAAPATLAESIPPLSIIAGLASVRILRIASLHATAHAESSVFLAILRGRAQLRSRLLGMHALETDDVCVIPKGADYVIDAASTCEALEVKLPAA